MIVVALGSLTVAGFVASLFSFFRRKTEPAVVTGLGKKYELLIQLLKRDQQVKSERITSKSLTIKFQGKLAQDSYQLTEVEGRLIVVWTLESRIHGRRGKEWSFDVNNDQEQIYNEIQNDIRTYQKSLFREA